MENTQSKKILVVEDEKALRRALVDTLTGAGFVVLEASDGVEGLDIALKQRPDLVLTDRDMPGMDGLKMLGEIRKDEGWGKKVPVVVLTNLSLSDDESVKGVSGLNPTYYLVKADWDISDIVANVKSSLGG